MQSNIHYILSISLLITFSWEKLIGLFLFNHTIKGACKKTTTLKSFTTICDLFCMIQGKKTTTKHYGSIQNWWNILQRFDSYTNILLTPFASKRGQSLFARPPEVAHQENAKIGNFSMSTEHRCTSPESSSVFWKNGKKKVGGFFCQMLLAVNRDTAENSPVRSLLFVGSKPADAVTVRLGALRPSPLKAQSLKNGSSWSWQDDWYLLLVSPSSCLDNLNTLCTIQCCMCVQYGHTCCRLEVDASVTKGTWRMTGCLAMWSEWRNCHGFLNWLHVRTSSS